MFRFTTRHLIGLSVIAAVSSSLTTLFAPFDPYSELLMLGFLLVFGGACYVAGVALERGDKLTPPPKT